VSGLWQRYSTRFDALTLRERVMVFAAVMVVVMALGYTLAIEPQLLKQKRLATAMLQKQSEMKAFETQVGTLLGSAGPGAQRSGRERLAQLRAELAALEARIRAEERRFTAPAQMRRVIEGLLARNRGVALEEMKTLAVDTVSAAAAATAALASQPVKLSAKPAPQAASGERLIYRHGVELTVSGSYLDLLAYARDLEKLPSQLYWGALELDAGAYPKVSMKLVVYTLSLDPAWLSV
jgi:MSHA biogenesis protein MshJ